MNKKKSKSKGSGGARKGAGRPKTGIVTTTLHIRIPLDRKEEFKELVYARLKEPKGGLMKSLLKPGVKKATFLAIDKDGTKEVPISEAGKPVTVKIKKAMPAGLSRSQALQWMRENK